MFKEVPTKVDFPSQEETILQYWEAKDIFQRSITQRENAPYWVFYDGPPGTNGQPHVGHMMQSALKDLFGRYRAMKGFQVLRKAGWDTHGLPIELTAERELKLKSKRDIEKYGVENYIEYCRNTVFRYKKDWEDAIRRIGRFIDLENAYATLTKDYIQSDWWTIKNIWRPSPEMREKLGLNPQESLLYKDYRISPYCHRCGTTLSNFETAQGYKDTVDFALFPKFRSAKDPNLYYVAWTTTAWTLLSNVALALGPEIEYITLKLKTGEKLLIADTRLHSIVHLLGEYEIIHRSKGKEWEGEKYLPLWDFLEQPGTNAHSIIIDEYVTAEDGTGIVHLAAYGEDDFRIIRNRQLPLIQNVDENGECHAGQFSGRYFKDETLDVDIIKDLSHRNLLLHREKHEHSYPFCFRCDEALMYFPRASWFIKTSRIKDKLLEANRHINWYPEHIKEGRFGNWLENNIDWNITRERYWGSPLPIWTCEKCGNYTVVESLTELDRYYYHTHKKHLPENFDPHKPYIDEVELKCSCNGVMKRENFVLDSWFNAGIMPWAQFGYPDTPGSVELLKNQFPGDFICEAIDQTRGWFYTMLAAAVLVKGETSFKNVICTELILDQLGQKMSKSKGNVVHPMAVFNKFGADPCRWVFFNSHPWLVKNFSDDLMVDNLRKVIIPLWNAYSFLVTYANVDGWSPAVENHPGTSNNLDRWIVSEFQSLLKLTTQALDNYDVATAANGMENFIDLLTNWYIRRSRRRFWKSENDSDKNDAYRTLYFILLEFIKILAPFLPFISEEIYLNLTASLPIRKDSVHLEDFPLYNPEYRDIKLEEKMKIVQESVTLGRALRNDHKIKTRQPLPELKIFTPTVKEFEEYSHIIAEELNVKCVSLIDEETLNQLIAKRFKPKFSILGPRLGSRMNKFTEIISKMDYDEIMKHSADGLVVIENEEFYLKDDLEIEEVSKFPRLVFKRGANTAVVLNINLTADLIEEGYSREFINKVQNLRKEMQFNITDRIEVKFTADERLTQALGKHAELICREVLAVKFDRVQELPNAPIKINDKIAKIQLQKSTVV